MLRSELLAPLRKRYSHHTLLSVVRAVLQESRVAIASGSEPASLEVLTRQVVDRAAREWVPPQPVLNATGVILHTNLGRAPLSRRAIDAMAAASGYTDLEYDLDSGRRGSRQDLCAPLLQTLTGAQSALVTVNNASAILLALASIANRHEVIVSRGQAVEIGGGFRVPVIARQSGARLIEVGTTNKTRLEDYEEAIGPRTAAIMHVHPSNFQLVGFTETATLRDLAGLARSHHIPLIVDNGSGSLLDTRQFGLAHEPTPVDAIVDGSDLVTFSGDKLLGGPQAGIIVGRRDLVERLKVHPLARAIRPDKHTLAALAATLMSYLEGTAVTEIPVWQMIGTGATDIETRAKTWNKRASQHGLSVSIQAGESTIGGGSLPGETLPTFVISLPATITASALRLGSPSIVSRTKNHHVLIDLRTVPVDRDDALLDAVVRAHKAGRSVDEITTGIDKT